MIRAYDDIHMFPFYQLLRIWNCQASPESIAGLEVVTSAVSF